MRFMNAYVEAQIPVMRNFLRDISSLPGHGATQSADYVSPVANHIDCGYELACLQSICSELFNGSNVGSSQQSSSSSVSVLRFPYPFLVLTFNYIKLEPDRSESVYSIT